jgi:Raf kinase inhibitor-like YbhB/YbcL family protein
MEGRTMCNRSKLSICVQVIFGLLLVCLAVAALGKTSLVLVSSAFKHNGMIPKKYSGYGKNISPPLKWSGVPAKVKSFALICDDPDAPGGTFVHWVMFNIPASVHSLKENLPKSETLPDGTIQGVNDTGSNGYYGPEPPSGTHRYMFKLYALSTELDLESTATKADLLKAMKGKILAQTVLIGKYKK